MLVAPISFILASSASVFVVDFLGGLIGNVWGIVNLIPYGLFWLLFTFIYLFMPNKNVHGRSAMLGGIVASCLYLLVQWGYIYFQLEVSRYGAVYGSMAALPLLLIWIQLSWFILLFGAEISCAHQTASEHEFEGKAEQASHSFRRLLALWMVHLSLKGFLTVDMLVHRYQIPFTLVKSLLRELVDCHILHEARGGYVPSHEAQNLRISELIEKMDSMGENHFPFIEANALAPFEKALTAFRELIESSPQNTRLSHVPHSF
jgi:membrane protein